MDMLAAIRAQREEIAKKIAALQAEDDELVVAERVVARLTPATINEATNSRSGQPPRQTDLIISTLRTMRASWAPDWAYLQNAIMELYRVEIPKSSLQPYLSNLKNDGIIVRDGPKIALRERVEKGAGPLSDDSYDPNTAAVEDDDDKTQPSLMRLRERADAVRRAASFVKQNV